MSCFVAIDLESTGLLKPAPPQPGIVEIGAVIANLAVGGEDGLSRLFLRADFSQIIDPECPFEEEAQKITGLRPEDFYGKPNLKAAFLPFAKFVMGCEYLVTFNGLAFDVPLLSHNLERYGLQWRFPWPPIHLDLMEIATPYLNLPGRSGAKPPKLIELYQHLFEESFDGQHRATSDAKATMRCAQKMHEKGWLPI